jgi:hypothetical protein
MGRRDWVDIHRRLGNYPVETGLSKVSCFNDLRVFECIKGEYARIEDQVSL